MNQQQLPTTTRNNGRIIYIAGEINELVAQDVNCQLLQMQREDPLVDITMIIDSYGGEMFAAFAIVDMMNIISCDIKTICIGKAMSAGQFIFSCGTKGKRFMSSNARLMVHQPIAGVEGSLPDIEVEIEELMRSRDNFVTQIARHSKLACDEVKELINRNAYLDATEAIDLGFADGILTRIN